MLKVNSLRENVYQSPCGPVHYWISILNLDAITLVFLPGPDCGRLFGKQIDCFCDKYNIVVWDAPAHAASWPGFMVANDCKCMAGRDNVRQRLS